MMNTLRRVFNLLRLNDFSSKSYWDKRYQSGNNSGPGSYGQLAEYKARIINTLVHDNNINSVIEFGCGDGNQLTLSKYPSYVGYDVSSTAVANCRTKFLNDQTKDFFLVDDYKGEDADLAISLDVIFHLVEEDVFNRYMTTLFNASRRYVIIYSSNQDEQLEPISPHVKHRRFTDWVRKTYNDQWILNDQFKNPYPYNGDYKNTSFSDFYIYQKA